MTSAEGGTAPENDPATTAQRLADLDRRLAQTRESAPGVVERRREQGRRTARERVEALLDEGSFSELDALAAGRSGPVPAVRPGDSVVTGHGTVDGRPVVVFAHDATVLGGSLGEAAARRIVKAMDLALSVGAPIVGLHDSGGPRVQEGVASLAGHGDIFARHVQASGVVPQISVVMGPSVGAAVYSPALTDFTVMVEGTSQMFITGPDVIRTVTGEDVTLEELGGAHTHTAVSGNAHQLAATEDEALDHVRQLLGYLPSNNHATPPAYDTPVDEEVTEADEELDTLVPDSANVAYDVHDLIEHLVDDAEFYEIQPAFAPNIVVGLARVEGHSVGVVANQPSELAGTLDIDAAEKAARFVRTCDAFNVPVVTLVDVPGFLPGTGQEWAGLARRSAKLIYAYAEATVPKITVVTRKAYGGAYDVMASKHLGADVNLAWPTARIAVAGAQGAVGMLYRDELRAAAEAGEDLDAVRARLVRRYEETVANPYAAAERGDVDAVIRPSHTRTELVRALRITRTKHQPTPVRKHGNMPL